MIIGTASFCKSRWEKFSEYGEIVSIYFLPDYIGKGYGNHLLRKCIEELKEKIENGLPVFGTCAGLILLASNLSNDNRKYFATLPVTVKRNAYGRQLGSFHATEDFSGIGKIPMTFIRAPYIEEVLEGAEALAKVDGKIVAARQGKQLVTAFHPELDEDTRVHEYFLSMIEE